MLSPINANRAIINAKETKALIDRPLFELDALPPAERRALHDGWERMAAKVTRTKLGPRRNRGFWQPTAVL